MFDAGPSPDEAAITITRAPDIDAAALLLSTAFADDPVTCWAFPTSVLHRERYLQEFFRHTTEIVLAQGGWVAHSDQFDGMLSWLPPGHRPLTSDQARDSMDELQAVTGPCGHRVSLLMEELERRHPVDLPAHCAVVAAGISPASRSSGLLRGLVGRFREHAIAHGAGVYAEASSQRSLRLWKRLGLREYGEPLVMPDGPSLYPIFAEAHSIRDTQFSW